jgi:hypothetical protein
MLKLPDIILSPLVWEGIRLNLGLFLAKLKVKRKIPVLMPIESRQRNITVQRVVEWLPSCLPKLTSLLKKGHLALELIN